MRSYKPLYTILGAYFPLSILIMWAPLPGIIYGFLFQTPLLVILFDKRVLLLAGFFSALGASCYEEVMRKSMLRRSAADMRGGIAVLAAAYIFSSLLRRNLLLAECFLPAADTIVPALAALYVWFSVISNREIFGGLELFESLTSQYGGEELRRMVRDYSYEMIRTDQRLKNLMLSYGVQFIIPGFLICAAGLSRLTLSVILPVFFIFSAGFLILGFLGILRRELSIAPEGIFLCARDRALPLPVITAGISVSVILALACSFDSSLLPPGFILGILGWILGLFLGLIKVPVPADLERLEDRFMPWSRNIENRFPNAGEMIPLEVWKWIRYSAMGAAVFLFLLFMIYPLFKRSVFSFRAGKIYAALSLWVKELRKGIAVLFRVFRKRPAPDRNFDSRKLRRIASELIPDKARRKDMKKSVNLFARLILWGIETLGVSWKSSCAPGEYCGLLSSAYSRTIVAAFQTADSERMCGAKETCDAINRSGELFEKALYSPRRLPDSEEKEFRQLIDSITGI